MRERASDGKGGDSDLALGPRWIYPLERHVMHARSLAWLLRGRPFLPGARILFFHRVSPDPDPLAVHPERFEEHLVELVDSGLRTIDAAELGRRLDAGDPCDGLVGLCFDDGYRDVAEHALPQLERHDCSASVFVATAVTSGEACFSWYERQPPLLSWEEIVELDGDSPLRFEAHTRTHPNLVRLDEAEARAEIAGGKRELEERLGRAVEAFCYPAGLFGPRERALVAEAGFRVAVTCEPGANTPVTDPLALHRIQVDGGDALLDLQAKLAGAHDTPLAARTAWRRLRYGPVNGKPRAASSSR